jgi:hypothetical protein
MSTDHDDDNNDKNKKQKSNKNSHQMHPYSMENDDDDHLDTILQNFCTQQRYLLNVEYNHITESSTNDTLIELPTYNTNNTSQCHSTNKTNALNHLRINDISIGLYGRTVIRFVHDVVTTETTTTTAHSTTTKQPHTQSSSFVLLPAHKFTTGDDVDVRYSSSSSQETSNHKVIIMSGVICEVTETSLSVAMSSTPSKTQPKSSSHNHRNQHTTTDWDDTDLWNDTTAVRFTIVPKSQRIIYEKLIHAIQLLEQSRRSNSNSSNSEMIRAMFRPHWNHGTTNHTRTQTPPPPPQQQQQQQQSESDHVTSLSQNHPTPLLVPSKQNHDTCHSSYQNPNLDESQKEAIHFALSNSHHQHHYNTQPPITLIHGPVT